MLALIGAGVGFDARFPTMGLGYMPGGEEWVNEQVIMVESVFIGGV